MEHDLVLIPVINKIDLPAADPEEVRREIQEVIGLDPDEAILASAKDGTGVKEILEAAVTRIPPPGRPEWAAAVSHLRLSLRPLQGVVAYVRVFDGTVRNGEPLFLMATERRIDAIEIGVFRPDMQPVAELQAGEVGYIATGLKSVRESRVGDTITSAERPAPEALADYQPANPMVFAGLFPSPGRITQCYATRWIGSSSTMPAWSSSRKARLRSALATALASSVCFIWRLCASDWSANMILSCW
jgi:GTP-binding protein LepA